MRGREQKRFIRESVPTFLGILFCLAIFALISGLTTLYADDFYYATFFKNGFSNFLAENIRHYQFMNGRALVHLIDQVVLLFGTPLFAVLNPLMLFWLYWCLGKTLFGENNKNASSFSFCALLLTLFLPQTVLRESLYWITGSMNYLLPSVLLALAFYLQRKAMAHAGAKWWHFVLCFLCGATTEQGGAATFGVLLSSAFFVKDKSFRKKESRICGLKLSVCTLLGYLTVILSPGTRFRASYEGGPLFSRLGESFESLSALLMGENGIIFYIATIFLLVTVLSGAKRGLSRLFGIFVIPALLFFAIWLKGRFLPGFAMMDNEPSLMLCVAIISCIVLAIGFLCADGYKGAGVLLLGTMATQAVMLLAPSTYIRTLLPTMLFLVACIAFLFIKLFAGNKKTAFLFGTLFLILAVFYIAPTISGYWQNKKIALQNEAGIQKYSENKNAEICVDMNPVFGYTMFYEDGFFTKYFYQCYDLPQNPSLYYTGAAYPKTYFKDARITHPAVRREDSLYLPLASVAEKKGAILSWEGDVLTIETGSEIYTLSENVLSVKNGSYSRDIKNESTRCFGKIYWDKALVSDIFGTVVHEKDGAVYISEK